MYPIQAKGISKSRKRPAMFASRQINRHGSWSWELPCCCPVNYVKALGPSQAVRVAHEPNAPYPRPPSGRKILLFETAALNPGASRAHSSANEGMIDEQETARGGGENGR